MPVNFPECQKCQIKILFGIQCYDINIDKKEVLCENCWKKNKENYQQLIKEGKSVLVTKGKYDQNGGYHGESIENCKTCQKWNDDFENRILSSFCFCSTKCEELEELKILQSRKDYSLGRNNSPGRPLDSNEKQRLENLKRKYNNPPPHNPSNNNPNQPVNSNNFNWKPWLIGGVVIILVGLITYWFVKRNNKAN